MRLKDAVWAHLSELGAADKNSAVVTTNWDSLLWDKIEINSCFQLHGLCTIPRSVYLPTQTTLDAEATQQLISKLIQNAKDPDISDISDVWELPLCTECKKEVLPTFRWTSAGISQLGRCHRKVGEWLINAKKLIIYGVSWHIYQGQRIKKSLSLKLARDSFQI